MVHETKTIKETTSAQGMEDWFNEFLAQISADKLMLETNTATSHKVHLYNTMINGSERDLVKLTRSTTTMYYLKSLLVDYFQLLGECESQPIHLALDLSDSKILVWAEIEDENTRAEDNLFLTEAKVNAKYAECGFYISSTIVEKSDLAAIPPHYKKVK